MTVGLRVEQVKDVVIKVDSSWGSVPQSGGSWEESARMETCSIPMEYGENDGGSLQCACRGWS